MRRSNLTGAMHAAWFISPLNSLGSGSTVSKLGLRVARVQGPAHIAATPMVPAQDTAVRGCPSAWMQLKTSKEIRHQIG